MDLWIRSQDKRILQKVDNVYVDANYENRRICTNDSRDYESNLGEYKTEKRALEVLDEIQKLLNPFVVFKNCNCPKDVLDEIKEAGACFVADNAHIEQMQTCIYEMPEE